MKIEKLEGDKGKRREERSEVRERVRKVKRMLEKEEE